MIHLQTGNMFKCEANALVNTVNTVGVMGKGIALQFKKVFPENFRVYYEACREKKLLVGKLLVTEDNFLAGRKVVIINFPTKTHWRLPSEYQYIDSGLKELERVIRERNIQSIAIPALGVGNGGLEWVRVRQMIENQLSGLSCTIFLFEPAESFGKISRDTKISLTPARAMLLSVLYDLAGHGELVSEFSAEKIAYFLQRFGAQPIFNLDFRPYFYGPYSGKVKHVLHYLNGNYIMNYGSKEKRPFDVIGLHPEGEASVKEFLNRSENEEFSWIVDRTKAFLKGFYSSFALQLLSTIDFLKSQNEKCSEEEIELALGNWSSRKRNQFNQKRFVRIAFEHLNSNPGFVESGRESIKS